MKRGEQWMVVSGGKERLRAVFDNLTGPHSTMLVVEAAMMTATLKNDEV